MHLTVSDVAGILQISENTVYRWVHDRNLPTSQVNGQYRFDRAQLLEWATNAKVEIRPLAFANGPAGRQPRLDDALRSGGVFHDLPGDDKPAVLRELVQRLPLPADYDRDGLLYMLRGREALGSTSIGEGIALPHPRFPVVHPNCPPQVTLCFLRQPVDFKAPDGQPVHTLFALLSPTVRTHLQLLARLVYALRDPGFREVLHRKGSAEEVLVQATRLEQTLDLPAHEPVLEEV